MDKEDFVCKVKGAATRTALLYLSGSVWIGGVATGLLMVVKSL